MNVCCECCVVSCRGLCKRTDHLSRESYRLWYVVLCDLETSWMRRSWPTAGCRAKNKTNFPCDLRNAPIGFSPFSGKEIQTLTFTTYLQSTALSPYLSRERTKMRVQLTSIAIPKSCCCGVVAIDTEWESKHATYFRGRHIFIRSSTIKKAQQDLLRNTYLDQLPHKNCELRKTETFALLTRLTPYSTETVNFSSGEKYYSHFRNPNVHYSIRNSPLLVPVLSHMNSVLTLTFYFLTIRLHIYRRRDLSNRLSSSLFSDLLFSSIYQLCHACYTLYPSHCCLF